MKIKIKKNLVTITGILLGLTGGLLYRKFVGCASGTCPITSSWKIMLIYGGIMGGLIGNMIQDIIIKIDKKSLLKIINC